MRNHVIDKAIELATEHSVQIKKIANRLGGTERSYVKMVMTAPEHLDKEMLKHIYYRDAYARLVNTINFTELDKESWRPKDYIDAFLPYLYEWAETEDARNTLNMFLKDASVMIAEDQKVQPEHLAYQSALAQAVLKEVFYSDNGKEGRSPPEPDPGSPESEPNNEQI